MIHRTKDPACGRKINLRDAIASAVSEGQRFYFCSVRCHAVFLDTPHRYVGWAPRPSRLPRALAA